MFSRYPVGGIERSESKHRTVDLFTEVINNHGAPKVVHADNGAAMRSAVLVETSPGKAF